MFSRCLGYRDERANKGKLESGQVDKRKRNDGGSKHNFRPFSEYEHGDYSTTG